MVRKRQLLEDRPKVFTCNGERKYRAVTIYWLGSLLALSGLRKWKISQRAGNTATIPTNSNQRAKKYVRQGNIGWTGGTWSIDTKCATGGRICNSAAANRNHTFRLRTLYNTANDVPALKMTSVTPYRHASTTARFQV